MLITQGIL